MSARALINIYNDLDIKCPTCSKVVKMGDLSAHEEKCGRTQCFNTAVCGGFENKKIKSDKPVCTEKCELLLKLLYILP